MLSAHLLLPLFACAFCALALAAVAARPSATPSADRPLPKVVDLRPQLQRWGLEPRRQGSRGTCSVFALTGALEYAVAHRQQRGTRLSVEFLNWAGHKAAHRTVDGGFFSELWKGYESYGICPEEEMPYQPRFDPDLQPTEAAQSRAREMRALGLRLHWIKEWDVKTGLTEEQFREIKRVLSRKWPVCGGMRWPKQERWEQDVLQMCPPEEVFDGHSVLLVGYRDDPAQPGGGLFLIRNSGGEGRDGFLPYAYARAYINDAAWIEAGAPPKTGLQE